MKFVTQFLVIILSLLACLSLIACSGSTTVTQTQTFTQTISESTTVFTESTPSITPEATTAAPPTTETPSLAITTTSLSLPGWEKFDFQDNWLHAVWGSSASDVFVVGRCGTILHYDGVAWDLMDTGVINELHDVWGTSSNDVFAVGDRGIILHYDGNDWNVMPSGTDEYIFYIGGSSPEDVIAVTQKSTILVYDGKSWHTREKLSLPGNMLFYTVWASSSSQIFVIAPEFAVIIEGYYFLYFNGVEWLPMKCEAIDYYPLCIWGSSPTDVYAGGNQIIVHFDGEDWNTATDLSGVVLAGWANSPSDVIAVGYDRISDSIADSIIILYDGEEWRKIDIGQEFIISDVWGSIHSEIFVVIKEHTILHYNGQ